MAANGSRHRKLTPSPMETLNLRPCLVNVPSGEVITSYSQLSRIVKKLGWKVFIDVSGNVWSAWYLPAGEACFIQMVFLPHPHISTATFYQLSTVIHALGANTFSISYAPLRKFRELEAYSDLHKPTVRVRATGREIFTIRALTQILAQHGWRKESENQFIKQETADRSQLNLVSVIKIPTVENLHQLSTLDLEYIALVTDNVFSLQSPSKFQLPRKQEGKPPRIPPANSTPQSTELSLTSTTCQTTAEETTTPQTTPETSVLTTSEGLAPQATAENSTSETSAEKTSPQTQTAAEKITPNITV